MRGSKAMIDWEFGLRVPILVLFDYWENLYSAVGWGLVMVVISVSRSSGQFETERAVPCARFGFCFTSAAS